MKRKPSDVERLASALEKLADAINTLSIKMPSIGLAAYQQPYPTPTNPYGPHNPDAIWIVPLGGNQC